MDRGLRYTTTIALSQRLFSNSSLEWATFDTVVKILDPWIVRENLRFRACLCLSKILAIGLYRLAHGNSYLTIGPAFNVGKSTVIEAEQDAVGALAPNSPFVVRLRFENCLNRISDLSNKQIVLFPSIGFCGIFREAFHTIFVTLCFQLTMTFAQRKN